MGRCNAMPQWLREPTRPWRAVPEERGLRLWEQAEGMDSEDNKAGQLMGAEDVVPLAVKGAAFSLPFHEAGIHSGRRWRRTGTGP